MWAAACGRAPGQGAGSFLRQRGAPAASPAPHCTKQGLCRGRVAHWGPRPPFEPELPGIPMPTKAVPAGTQSPSP